MSSMFESLTGQVDYPFPEYERPPSDPLPLAQQWCQEAVDQRLNEPRAMVLTTADAHGIMASRTMAILEFASTGPVFATHRGSRKIQHAEATQQACGHFYWREWGRQLSVSGTIRPLGRARAEAEWQQRPTALHAMSTVSRQSEPLLCYEQLLSAASQWGDAGTLPCPERFAVYVLEVHTLEFWAASAHRLHRRLRFERSPIGWSVTRLQP